MGNIADLAKDIRINTGNIKTGPSWSIPEGESCPGKTKLCAQHCYVGHGRMAWAPAKSGRSRNFHAALELLKHGSDTLASALNAAIKKSKAATIRIHDSGDFFNIEYIKAWHTVVRENRHIQFWAYTRSWRVPRLSAALQLLATEPNIALWVSADQDCWIEATIETKNECWAGMAFMETPGSEDTAAIMNKTFKKRFINFPLHTTFGRISVSIQEDIRNCPAVTKVLPHDDTSPACLRCKMCLPEGVNHAINGRRNILDGIKRVVTGVEHQRA